MSDGKVKWWECRSRGRSGVGEGWSGGSVGGGGSVGVTEGVE